MSDDVALFAGDVMGTGYHAARPRLRPATASRCSGSARSGCAPCRPRCVAGAAQVIAVDTVAERLEMARVVRRAAPCT